MARRLIASLVLLALAGCVTNAPAPPVVSALPKEAPQGRARIIVYADDPRMPSRAPMVRLGAEDVGLAGKGAVLIREVAPGRQTLEVHDRSVFSSAKNPVEIQMRDLAAGEVWYVQVMPLRINCRPRPVGGAGYYPGVGILGHFLIGAATGLATGLAAGSDGNQACDVTFLLREQEKETAVAALNTIIHGSATAPKPIELPNGEQADTEALIAFLQQNWTNADLAIKRHFEVNRADYAGRIAPHDPGSITLARTALAEVRAIDSDSITLVAVLDGDHRSTVHAGNRVGYTARYEYRLDSVSDGLVVRPGSAGPARGLADEGLAAATKQQMQQNWPSIEPLLRRHFDVNAVSYASLLTAGNSISVKIYKHTLLEAVPTGSGTYDLVVLVEFEGQNPFTRMPTSNSRQLRYSLARAGDNYVVQSYALAKSN